MKIEGAKSEKCFHFEFLTFLWKDVLDVSHFKRLIMNLAKRFFWVKLLITVCILNSTVDNGVLHENEIYFENGFEMTHFTDQLQWQSFMLENRVLYDSHYNYYKKVWLFTDFFLKLWSATFPKFMKSNNWSETSVRTRGETIYWNK